MFARVKNRSFAALKDDKPEAVVLKDTRSVCEGPAVLVREPNLLPCAPERPQVAPWFVQEILGKSNMLELIVLRALDGQRVKTVDRRAWICQQYRRMGRNDELCVRLDNVQQTTSPAPVWLVPKMGIRSPLGPPFC